MVRDDTTADDMQLVFRALDDGNRRRLLDELFRRDGQTLGELCEHLSHMTRFGVMNHLRVLEEGGLITTRREGRSKLHYLNRVPIRLIHDRWISKFTEPTTARLAELKGSIERKVTMSSPVYVYQVFINATTEVVWNAMVDPDQTVQYFYGTRVESSWEPGTPIRYYGGDGSMVSDGEIISVDAPKRLEFTFQALWDPAIVAEGPAREVWLLEDVNGATKVTVELYDVEVGSATYNDFADGFPYILSGMKTLVETGKSLPAPY